MKNKLGIIGGLILSMFIATSAFADSGVKSASKTLKGVVAAKTAKVKKSKPKKHRKHRKLQKHEKKATQTNTPPSK